MSASLRFLHAHATHPHPELALELVWAQLSSQGAARMGATLGWCYMTEELAEGAADVLAGLRHRLPGVAWTGGVGAGVLASGVEYVDEPGLVVMLCNLPRPDFEVFHGRHPLMTLPPQGGPVGWPAFTAQVHADAQTPDLPELLQELAGRTQSGYLFGGLCTGGPNSAHLALSPEDALSATADDTWAGVWQGGLSGVAFSDRVRIVSRITQGCEPIGPKREVTAAHRNVIYELDGLPALRCLLKDLDVSVTVNDDDWQREALPKMRATLVGVSDAGSDLLSHGHHFGADTRVRHLIGLDPARHGVAISDEVRPGMQLAFCQRHVQAARQDLIRLCAEVREEFDPMEHPGHPPAGAIYISCSGRGGPHFGTPNAEMEIIAHALGDLPLVGFFAGGEIARQHLYGYTGVLTVFGA